MTLKDKRVLVYLSMTFYIFMYYMFIIFFKNQSEQFFMGQFIFKTLPLLFTFLALLRLNLKDNSKSFFLFALLLGVVPEFTSAILEIYYKVLLKADFVNYSIVDILSIISSIIFLTALIYKFHKKDNRRSTLGLTIDLLTIMSIAFAVTWTYIIYPHINSQGTMNLYETIFYLIYPILNLGILFISIMLFKCMHREDPEKKSMLIFSVALFFMYLANIGYAYLTSINKYSGGSITDPLWTISYFLLLITAGEYYKSKNIKWNKSILSKKESVGLNSIFQGISTILLFLFIVYEPSRVVCVCFGISIGLMTISKILADSEKKELIIELEDLNKCLEGKVEERTKKIHEAAFYDHLTGLANRRLFEDMSKHMIKECKTDDTELFIMLLDIDRFKTVNDTYGHSFGDLLIKEFANFLKDSITKNCIISRQGGDEFAIAIGGNEGVSGATRLSEKILRKLISPITLQDQNVYTTCSIGIASYPLNGQIYEDIIRCADLAMYHSKALGRNTYSFYDEHMFKLNSNRMTFERELHKAIEKKEFVLYYQPQVDIEQNKVVGVEALIRWNHPTQGIISPFQFINIAEETGLIGPIGKWVLETACKQTKIWHNKGFETLKVGVNISAYQFQQENFVDMVQKVIQETDIDPRCLDLEITESVAMKNEVAVITKLKKLKKLGIEVSMDDFGTGYSSLSYLNRFPIDTLKIPREFVIEIKPYDDNKNIIEAIIAIGQKLELSIIAEGVENEVQLNFLKEKNCKLIQGYIFSKPLPEDEVENFLNKKL